MPSVTEETVRQLLVEFSDAVRNLPNLSDPRRKEVIAQCCEVSRDIRLFVGPPGYVSRQLLEDIERLFQDAVVAIEKLHMSDAKIDDYRTDIEVRAQVFRDAIEMHPARQLESGHGFRLSVAKFLETVEADYGEAIMRQCHQKLGLCDKETEMDTSTLIAALEEAVSNLRQPEIQEAVRIQRMPFNSNP